MLGNVLLIAKQSFKVPENGHFNLQIFFVKINTSGRRSATRGSGAEVAHTRPEGERCPGEGFFWGK